MRSSPRAAPGLKLMLATYFGGLGDNLTPRCRCRSPACTSTSCAAPEQLDAVLAKRAARTSCCRSAWSTAATSGAPTCGAARSRSSPWSRSAAPTCGSRRPARCCTCRSTWISETELDPELKSWLAFAVQKLGELASLGQRARPRAATRSRTRSTPRPQLQLARRPRRACTTRRSRRASPPSTPDMAAAQARLRRARDGCSRRASICRPFRPRRSARSRRRRRCARRAPPTPRARSSDAATTTSCATRPRAPSAGRRSSASTCSCTASPSATTWSSTSASSSTASPSPSTAGCSATARAA